MRTSVVEFVSQRSLNSRLLIPCHFGLSTPRPLIRSGDTHEQANGRCANTFVKVRKLHPLKRLGRFSYAENSCHSWLLHIHCRRSAESKDVRYALYKSTAHPAKVSAKKVMIKSTSNNVLNTKISAYYGLPNPLCIIPTETCLIIHAQSLQMIICNGTNEVVS